MATRATATITMSMREAYRVKVVQAVLDRMLRVDTAAKRIGVTTRQIERLLIRYKEEGPPGLTSRKRGKPSNHQLPAGLAEHAVDVIRDRYLVPKVVAAFKAAEVMPDRKARELQSSTEPAHKVVVLRRCVTDQDSVAAQGELSTVPLAAAS